MIFEKFVYVSIILLFLSYYVYRYVKNSSKIALLNIAMQVVAITMLVLIYKNQEDINKIMQATVFVLGYIIPITTFFAMKFNINIIKETKIVIGNILSFCNHNDKAKKLYDNMVKEYPKYRVYKKLGEICLKQNDLDNSLEYLQKAITIKPNSYKLYCKIAYIEYSLKKYDEAITILKNVLNIKSNYMPACNLLANILTFKKNQYNEALKMYFDLSQKDKTNSKIYYNIGAIYIKEKQNKNAKKFLEQAIKYDNRLYNAHYLLGYIHLSSKEYDVAQQHLLIAIKGSHTYARAYYMLARLYMLQNEKGKATNCLNLAIARDDSLLDNMHNEELFSSIKDLANGVDKIEKLANENQKMDKNNIIDITMFDEFNVDQYVLFEQEDIKKQEVLANTVGSKNVKSKKSKRRI